MPIDIIAFIVILVVSFFAIMYFGKSSGVSAILSFYPTLLVYTYFPYSEKLLSYARSPFETSALKIALFTLLLLLSYIAMRHAVSVVFSWTPILKLMEAVILAIILTGLLFCSYIFVADLSSYIATPILQSAFIASQSLFWWLTSGVIVLLLTIKR